MKRKHEIMLDVARIAGTRYFNRALMLLKTLVVARVLGPSSYGLIGVISLVPLYAQYADLGLLGALTRQVPMLGDGTEDRDRRRQMTNAVASAMGVMSALVFAGVVIAGMLTADPEARACLFFAAGVIVTQQAVNFFQNELRIAQDFTSVARSIMLLELSGIVYTVALVLLIKSPGYFFAVALANLTAVAWLLRHFRQRGGTLGWHWDLRLTGQLVVAGLPLVSTNALHNFALSMDRAVMSRAASTELVGHYMLALLVAGVIQFVPDSVGYILFPLLRERLGKGQSDPASLQRYLREPTEAIAWVITFFIAGAVLFLPLVPLILPAYRPGLEPARVLTLFTFFMAINSVALSHLVAVKENWRKLLAVQLVVVALAPALVYGALRLELGVRGVALAMGTTYLVYGLSTQALALATCGLGLRDILGDLLRICLPLIYLAPALWVIQAIVERQGLEGVGAVIAGVLLFVPASLPLVWGLLRRTPLMQVVRRRS